MEALGRLVDLSIAFAPVDMQTGTNTGKRVSLRNAGGITFILFKAAGTAGDDPVVSFQQHTALSSGTSSSLAVVDHYYYKAATTLAGTETWVRTTQAAGASITDPGGLGTSAETQMILVVEIESASLSDGYNYVSMNVADVGGNAQLGCGLYALRDLEVKRKPANLAAALS